MIGPEGLSPVQPAPPIYKPGTSTEKGKDLPQPPAKDEEQDEQAPIKPRLPEPPKEDGFDTYA